MVPQPAVMGRARARCSGSLQFPAGILKFSTPGRFRFQVERQGAVSWARRAGGIADFLKSNNDLTARMNTEDENIPGAPGPAAKKGIVRRIMDLLSLDRSPETTEALELEIQELLEEGEEHGLISSLEEKMINSIFDFRDTLAAEIMTPAAEIVSFEASVSVGALVTAVIEEGFTRMPIYRGNPDGIIGILHVKDLLKICAQPAGGVFALEDHLKPAYFISENKPVVELLKGFKKRKTHMALVTDEFGAVRGLITLEDVMEEIVGEIDDEYDTDQDTIEEINEDTIVIHARIDVEEVEERFQVTLPEGPYESIGGLVIHVLGRLAVVGDTVEVGNLRFVVKGASKRRIKMVEITRLKAEGKAE
jgi:CBS domain containing-hemolysin-like protein